MNLNDMRMKAKEGLQCGAVTTEYKGDLPQVLDLLDTALATEIVCFLRYQRHYYMARGIHHQSVADEFLEHSFEELYHADLIAKRMVQLGGEPDFNPSTLLSRSSSEYVEGQSLTEMISEDLIAERIAIDVYSEAIRKIGNTDPTTRRLFEKILASEENHAEDLASFIQHLKQEEQEPLKKAS